MSNLRKKELACLAWDIDSGFTQSTSHIVYITDGVVVWFVAGVETTFRYMTELPPDLFHRASAYCKNGLSELGRVLKP